MYTVLGSGSSMLLHSGILKEGGPYLWMPVLLASVLIIAIIAVPKAYGTVLRWFAAIGAGKSTGDATLDETIEAAGYSYDPEQDIFYSNMYPWQREMGYCRLYDEASAPLNMIIDCEPICFEYGGKRWMIEFWKGQYGMTTGGEIGIYNTKGPDMDIPEFFTGTFYDCADDADRLNISYSLVKNDEILFTRKGKHWWLTGFKLGEFSEPSELTMYLSIALKNSDMRDAFVGGLKEAGYSEDELFIDGNIVGLVFYKTRTPQPITRIEETDWLIQRKNELLCDKYREITGPYDNFHDKMNAIRELAPEIYDAVLSIGKTKQLYKAYERLKAYMS